MEGCLDKRLLVYVKGFVFYVEKHIQDSVRDAQIVAKPEPGRSVEIASSAAGAAAGLAATKVNPGLAGAALGIAKTGVEKIYGLVSSDEKKGAARDIEDALRFTKIYNRVWVLVEAAGQLFMSYEQAFMSLTGTDKASVWIQLLKLAADAADRLCNHIIANNGIEVTVESIVDAVRSGSSNNSSLLSHIVPDWAKNWISDSERGHCVSVNETKEKTCNVYAHAGLVTVSSISWEHANMGSKLEVIFNEICAEYKELRDVLTYYAVSSSLPADIIKPTTSAKRSGPENAAIVDLDAKLIDPDSIIRTVNEMIPTQPKIYTSRAISNRLLLKSDLFKQAARNSEEQDVFVFKGMSRSGLNELIKPNEFSYSSTQRSIVNCKHIFLENEGDWDDIVASNQKHNIPTHLITKENGKLVLQQSTAVSNLIFRYAADEKRVESAYVSEDYFVKQLLSAKTGALLCDVPGMGKTLLMTSITRKYKNESENSVVVFVTLSSAAKDLKRHIKKDDAIEHILRLRLGPNTAKQLVGKIQETNLHVMLFLDGFDEIKDEYVEPATQFLKTLNSLDNVQMVISSRPRMRVHLEETFQLVSFDILPFRKNEQIDAIVNNWLENHPNLILEDLKTLAEQCVSSVHNIDQEGMPEILGVPLKCYMLAIINQSNATRLCAPNKNEAFKICGLASAVSVCELYETFIETAIQRVEETLACPVDKDKLLSFHTYKALELLFPDIAPIYRNEKKIDPSIANQSEVSRVGLMQMKEKDCYEFLHRTFPEFLVAKLFTELWRGKIIYETDFMEVAGICFLQNVMSIKCNGFDDALKEIKFSPGEVKYSKALKVCEFNNSTMLGFMNSLYFNKNYPDNQGTTVERFRNSVTAKITVPSTWRNLINFKNKLIIKTFKATSLNVVLGCVEECLTHVLGLVVQILKSLQDPRKDPNKLLDIPDNIQNQQSVASRVYLLYRVAVKGYPEPTKDLFNFFTSLKELCENFPLEFYSPLEFACVANNLNMVNFFVDRVNVPKDRVIVGCIFDRNIKKQEEISIRTKIIGLVIGDKKSLISGDSFFKYLRSFMYPMKMNYATLRNFSLKYETSFKNIQIQDKTLLLEWALAKNDDEGLINLLLILFTRVAGEKKELFEPFTMLKSEEILGCLNVDEAAATFSNVRLQNCNHLFNHINKIETLKILMNICDDIARQHDKKWSYLHFAVHYGRMDWIHYLISQGVDMNQKDKEQNTPLHLVGRSSGDMMQLVPLLLENGSNIFAVNGRQETFAHCVLRPCRSEDIPRITELLEYMHKPEYKIIWTMQDEHGLTPLQLMR